MFWIDGPFFFGVAAGLMDTYRRLGSVPRVLILRLEQVPMIDASGVAAIAELRRRADATHTRVILCGLSPQPTAMLVRARLGPMVSTATFAEALAQARAMSASG